MPLHAAPWPAKLAHPRVRRVPTHRATTRPEPNTPSNYLAKFRCLRGNATKPPANINQVMSRACGQTPEHTPLRVQSSACPRQQRMAYLQSSHTPVCNASPCADPRRASTTSRRARTKFKPLSGGCQQHKQQTTTERTKGGSPNDCLPLRVATPQNNDECQHLREQPIVCQGG